MVQIGSIHDVAITNIARNGDGMTMIDGLTIFIPNAKIGDNVKIRIDKVLTKFALARKI